MVKFEPGWNNMRKNIKYIYCSNKIVEMSENSRIKVSESGGHLIIPYGSSHQYIYTWLQPM